MNRIDIVRFRKEQGLTQRALAYILDIRPSFLSAIENGRSRMPEDKVDKLRSLYGEHSLDDHTMEDNQETTVPPHTHIHDEADSLSAENLRLKELLLKNGIAY